MKELSLEKMENLNGGDWQCAASVISLSASAIGAGISLAALQPWGVGLAVIGIYAGVPSMLYSCDLV